MNTIRQSDIEHFQPKPIDGQIFHVMQVMAKAEVKHREEHHDEYNFGYLPWKDTHTTFEFRPSELTIWAAESGIGKSLIQGFCMMHLALHKKKCVIGSFEMPVEDTFERQCAAYNGKNFTTSPDDKVDFAKRVDDHIYYYDFLGYITPHQVYQFISYSAEELECKHICIDSLMMISLVGQNRYEQQKDFVAELKALSKAYECHIHLVAHHRKPDGEKIHSRAKYSISGARS